MKCKNKILLALPIPPPYSGQEKIGSIILTSAIVQEFDCVHVDTSNHQKNNEQRGMLSLKNIYQTFLISFKLLFNLSKYSVDIVNLPMACNKYGFLKYSVHVLICAMFRLKIVSRLGGSHFNAFFEEQNAAYKKFIKFILSRISCIIVRGENQKMQFHGLYQGRIEVVYAPSTGIQKSCSRKRIIYSGRSELNVIFLSRVSQAKGAYDLLQAIPAVLAADDRFHFHFIGERVEQETNILHLKKESFDIEAFIKAHHLEEYVTFHGHTEGEAKSKIIWGGDMFVFPSYSEGSPFAVVEAMEFGLPLITTQVGNLPEILNEPENVLFVDVNSPDQIAHRILYLSQNEAMAAKMVKNNFGLIKDLLSIEKFEQKMIDIFCKVNAQ